MRSTRVASSANFCNSNNNGNANNNNASNANNFVRPRFPGIWEVAGTQAEPFNKGKLLVTKI